MDLSPEDQFYQRLLRWTLTCGIIAVLFWWALPAGWSVREHVFYDHPHMRHAGDLGNLFHQGRGVLGDIQNKSAGVEPAHITLPQVIAGVVNRYDIMGARGRPRQGDKDQLEFNLDYPPARLLIATLWVRHAMSVDPGVKSWDRADFTPLLQFNACCELAAMLAAFLLVRLWIARQRRDATGAAPPWGIDRWIDRGSIIGAIAALALWFDPAVLSDAHTWPQWDIWIVPFYLWAALFACIGGWFFTGAMIAIGCMFKGQLLIVAPVFLLWPIVDGRLDRALRLMIGFGVAGAVITWPWVVRTSLGQTWVTNVGIAAAVVLPMFWIPLRKGWRQIGPPIAAALVLWPWFDLNHSSTLPAALALAAVVLAAPFILRRSARVIALWVGAMFILSVAICSQRFNGSFWWYEIGFEWGTEHYLALAMGSASNLPAVMQTFFRWDLRGGNGSIDLGNWLLVKQAIYCIGVMLVFWAGIWSMRRAMERPVSQERQWLHFAGWGSLFVTIFVAMTILLNTGAGLWDNVQIVTMQHLLRAVYFALLLVIAIGMAIQARRNSTRMLVAIVAPWVVMFAIVPQMHERYLLWGAACGVILIGAGFGTTLLYLLITSTATLMQLHSLLPNDPEMRGSAWVRFMNGTHPGIGWMVTLLAGIVLYLAISPARKQKITRSRMAVMPARVHVLDRKPVVSEPLRYPEPVGA